MSRIAKVPVIVPDSVTVNLEHGNITCIGPVGRVTKAFGRAVDISYVNNLIKIVAADNSNFAKAMSGTARSIINSMVLGVSQGFSTELEIKGVGYRAILQEGYLNLSLGKSHSTKIVIPDYLTILVPKPNIVVVKSADKEKLGQYVALIKFQRPSEPYKGKGISRKGEYIERKETRKTK
ncbi:50S ribosomal protein L6 [Rickettsia endosymbiont of Cardiosporidium cionae]|uniref:50S ribosomal protein L6 n=1 Tax=Rickettsia endosymbiont of Cardiosporidium cionae TaxID=2777155 RepID=UPI001895BF8A|nr:50S ribosomal protein L6 [Rickettsia endosymbiont of Cardiosporidium cionae]KAF8818187.1 50S ribosomal protein L6 [Rickettsia endosymbiont of Cardiosporidium cionae]